MATSFNVNEADLAFILTQIKFAEAETAAVQSGTPPDVAMRNILGPNAAIVPFGLRHVDGSNNNLMPGGSQFGAADTVLPRLADPSDVTNTGSAPFGPVTNTSYANPGNVVDANPRTISNLIADQSNANPAAVAAWQLTRWRSPPTRRPMAAPSRPPTTSRPTPNSRSSRTSRPTSACRRPSMAG